MARVSICQAVLLLLCLQVTRARANRRLVGAQPQHDEVYGDVYKNAEPELQNEIIECESVQLLHLRWLVVFSISSAAVA